LLSASFRLDPILRGLRKVCSTWLSSVRRSPCQFRRKFNAALNTVGVLSSGAAPALDLPWRASAPFVAVSWQELQLSMLSWERRGSWNRRSPPAALRDG